MLVTCSALLQTLATLSAAAAIGVTGTCPGYMHMKIAPSGAVLDFSRATGVDRLDIDGINGLTVQSFTSVNTQYSAIYVVNSKNILLIEPRIISPGTAGVTISGSDTVEVSGAWITGSKGDGIDIAGSVNINIHDGACEGNVVTPGLHPDCVQAWSLAGSPITHLIVQNMIAVGSTQGFDLWDNVAMGATGVQDLSNHAAVTSWNCVGAINVARLVVSGNDCHTLPKGDGPPNLNIQSDPGNVLTNNSVGLPLAPVILK
jgi:hypothetical protein